MLCCVLYAKTMLFYFMTFVFEVLTFTKIAVYFYQFWLFTFFYFFRVVSVAICQNRDSFANIIFHMFGKLIRVMVVSLSTTPLKKDESKTKRNRLANTTRRLLLVRLSASQQILLLLRKCSQHQHHLIQHCSRRVCT